MFSYRVFLLGWIFDVVTTQFAMSRGFVETNPFYAGLNGMALFMFYFGVPVVIRVLCTLFGMFPGKWSYPLYFMVILFGLLHFLAGIRNILVMAGF